MADILKHAKVKTTEPQADGTRLITTKSFYEELNSVKEETQQSIRTSRATLLTDILKCLAIITDDVSKELTINIKDDHGRMTIVKTWTTRREYYGK